MSNHPSAPTSTAAYQMRVRRQLHNCQRRPVTRYLMRISVDRHPKTPDRSNELYRGRPLACEEIDLRALCLDEPLGWEVKHDRDPFKEVWLLFENEHRKLPVAEPFDLPRESAVARASASCAPPSSIPCALPTPSAEVRASSPLRSESAAAALVQLADEPPLVLYNPRIIDTSPEPDEQHEGCLSFFDVYGSVERSLQLAV